MSDRLLGRLVSLTKSLHFFLRPSELPSVTGPKKSNTNVVISGVWSYRVHRLSPAWARAASVNTVITNGIHIRTQSSISCRFSSLESMIGYGNKKSWVTWSHTTFPTAKQKTDSFESQATASGWNTQCSLTCCCHAGEHCLKSASSIRNLAALVVTRKKNRRDWVQYIVTSWVSCTIHVLIFTLLLSCGEHCLKSASFIRNLAALVKDSSNPYCYHNALSVCWKWYRLPLHRQRSYRKYRILYSCSRPWSRISYRYVNWYNSHRAGSEFYVRIISRCIQATPTSR